MHLPCHVATPRLPSLRLILTRPLASFQFIAVLISTPYVHITLDQKGIQNMQGFLYLIVTEVIFAYSYSVFHTFPHEMPVLLREIGNGLYSPGPYYVSKMLILVCVSRSGRVTTL